MTRPLKESTTLALTKEISSQICKDLEDEGEQQGRIAWISLSGSQRPTFTNP